MSDASEVAKYGIFGLLLGIGWGIGQAIYRDWITDKRLAPQKPDELPNPLKAVRLHRQA